MSKITTLAEMARGKPLKVGDIKAAPMGDLLDWLEEIGGAYATRDENIPLYLIESRARVRTGKGKSASLVVFDDPFHALEMEARR